MLTYFKTNQPTNQPTLKLFLTDLIWFGEESHMMKTMELKITFQNNYFLCLNKTSIFDRFLLDLGQKQRTRIIISIDNDDDNDDNVHLNT